jgi:tRNA uridine 5-carboxymethylaminomethyl modification enzyme
MIDDLINKGTDEPYRIFTSRAEYRLHLRQDNADSRLMRKGNRLGLIPDEVIDRLAVKEKRIAEAIQVLRQESVSPDEVNPLLASRGSGQVSENLSAAQILRRPEIALSDILEIQRLASDERIRILRVDREAGERVEIEVKYEGYLRRQDEQIRQFSRNESITIPVGFDFGSVKSLSTEGRERLQKIKPRSVGQASRISGVTPADISVLMIGLKQERFT